MGADLGDNYEEQGENLLEKIKFFYDNIPPTGASHLGEDFEMWTELFYVENACNFVSDMKDTRQVRVTANKPIGRGEEVTGLLGKFPRLDQAEMETVDPHKAALIFGPVGLLDHSENPTCHIFRRSDSYRLLGVKVGELFQPILN